MIEVCWQINVLTYLLTCKLHSSGFAGQAVVFLDLEAWKGMKRCINKLLS